MNREVAREGDRIVVRPQGDIVASVVQPLREELLSLVDESPGTLVMDLQGVGMIDSIGLGVLIATYNSLKKTGGDFKVVNASDDLMGLFRTMRLDRVFEIRSASDGE